MPWNSSRLGAVYAYAPSFEENTSTHEYGGGFMYERYPVEKLAMPACRACWDLARRRTAARLGAYVRWGATTKLAVLAEIDYTHLWNGDTAPSAGEQVTAYLQLNYNHTEWLVSSLTGNYGYSDSPPPAIISSSFRYTLGARLSRNLTIGASYANGDIQRNLKYGHEAFVFAA